MEHYIVSARKYRPSTFSTVIGQKSLTAALKHAVATDRLAHAYLFCGSRGVGKTSCARIFAKTINCQHRTPEGEACNECASCREFNNGTSLNIIELDAASHNGVDDIRSLIEQVLVPPTEGRYRVFIIDEVHMLSPQAFNAFLKTLEEPPEYVIFILATTEKHKIIPTILSRCQIYDFSRITIQDMVEHLQYVAANENITTEPAALNVIARKADGAMRDALSIFDQVAASTLGNVTYQQTIDNLNILDSNYYSRLIDAFIAGDVPTSLLIYKEIRDRGFDSQFFINGLALYLRDLMVAQNPSTINLLEASDDIKTQMATSAAKCSPSWIYTAMDLCNNADLRYKEATNKQFLIELTLVKLCQILSPAQQPAQQAPMRPVQPAQPAPQQPQAPQPAPQQRPQAQPAATPQTQRQAPQQYQAPQQHQAPHQQYQAPQPQHQAPQQQMQPQRRSGLPSFSISANKPQTPAAEAKADDTDDTTHRRNAEYSPDQLKKAWLAFIDGHPTERILINTMRAALPESIGGDNFTICVDSSIQVDTINNSKGELLQWLHDQLQNDNINFDITIRQGESSPITWTHREVLGHMIKKHPPLKDFIEKFSLSL